MDRESSAVTRRSAIGVVGATAAGAALLTGAPGALAAPAAAGRAKDGPAPDHTAEPVRLLLNGAAGARLRAEVVDLSGTREATTWTVRVTTKGRGTARDVRLTGVRRQQRWGGTEPLPVADRDPAVFPVPVTASLAPGACATFGFTVDLTGRTDVDPRSVVIGVSADGGRATTTASPRGARWPWAAKN